MKVLFITHHLKGNDGWSRYARDLALETKKNGADVLCLVNELDSKTPVAQEICLKKTPLFYLVNPVLAFSNSIQINKIIKNWQPDIVHIIVEPYGTMIPFLKKGNAKIVLTAHSTFAFIPILLNGLRRFVSNYITLWSFKRIDVVICVSHYTEEHLKRHMARIGGLASVENKTRIVSGGVAAESIERDMERDAVYPKTNSPKEILFVGALKPRKGLIEALDALAHVKTDFVFRIVGSFENSNPYVILIREKIAAHQLENKVILVGPVSDEVLNEMYKKADLFLMLSMNNGADFEGYGLVYIEANAKGVPVIGPKDSGVSDAVLPGKSGFLVDQFDSVSVAQTIERVLEGHTINPQDCVKWAWENRSELKAKKVFELYKGLVNKS